MLTLQGESPAAYLASCTKQNFKTIPLEVFLYVYEEESVPYDEPVRRAAQPRRQLIILIIPHSGGKCNDKLSEKSDAGREFRQQRISQAGQQLILFPKETGTGTYVPVLSAFYLSLSFIIMIRNTFRITYTVTC